MRFTITLILARALSRMVQSMVTLFFTCEINSAAMSFSLSSPSPQGEPVGRRRVSQQGNVVVDRRGFIARSAEGKGAGKLRHHLHPALLAALLFENVLLPGCD
jgi:hypothetical protein